MCVCVKHVAGAYTMGWGLYTVHTLGVYEHKWIVYMNVSGLVGAVDKLLPNCISCTQYQEDKNPAAVRVVLYSCILFILFMFLNSFYHYHDICEDHMMVM